MSNETTLLRQLVSARNKAEAAKRAYDAKLLECRQVGIGYRQIAKALDDNVGSVYKHINRIK